ncbi:hypothetical protein [Planctomonas deserti]|uniref:hypothetical protein n=1 Tax=Planctomonas deserti TaxID=2144185 RepID=UPI000D34778F|nr:hypothetical protein [Planctomonas deserti]
MDLLTVADELYALTPDRFTATRNDRAKAARAEGDRELAQQIARLSKPSAAAWAVNMLARHRAEVIDQVADLGAALRKAQEDLDSKRLREQSRLRHDLIRAIAHEGEQLADELGSPIGKPAVAEVEQTLQAAMADPDAADAVRTGRLLRSLSSNGIEAVDLDGAVALPEGRRAPVTSLASRRAEKTAATSGGKARGSGRDDGSAADAAAERAAAEEAARREKEERRRLERERADAKRAVESAEREVEEARAELDAIQRRIERLRPRRERLTAELDDLREQVAQLERTIASADADADRLETNREEADESVADAEDSLDRARRRLSRLTAD